MLQKYLDPHYFNQIILPGSERSDTISDRFGFPEMNVKTCKMEQGSSLLFAKHLNASNFFTPTLWFDSICKNKEKAGSTCHYYKIDFSNLNFVYQDPSLATRFTTISISFRASSTIKRTGFIFFCLLSCHSKVLFYLRFLLPFFVFLFAFVRSFLVNNFFRPRTISGFFATNDCWF